MSQRRLHFGLIGLWLIALCAGWLWMTRYQYAAESANDEHAPSQWPIGSTISRPSVSSTLLLFLHPQCPCSRASIAELESLLESLKNQKIALPNIYVVATVPQGSSGNWTQTETISRAAGLPGARIVIDAGGYEAAGFAARTSGSIMLFDAHGRRVYAGGITAGRGLQGENAGRSAIEALLKGQSYAGNPMPAFGCQLVLPSEHAPVANVVSNATEKQSNCGSSASSR